MTCRNGIRDGDLIQCLNLDAARMGEEIVGLERALKAWRVMIRSRSFSCVVIEDEGPSPEILCFGAAAFVSPVFVGEELASPRPGLNSRVIAAMDCGRSPLLSDAEIRFGNTYGGLDQVVLHVGWLRTLAPEAFSQVYTLMAFNYLEQHSGYRLNRLVTEITNPVQRALYEATNCWRVVRDFHGLDRALLVCDRESAACAPASVGSKLFQYTEPKLRLRDTDRQLLGAALDGLTDGELSRKLNLTLHAVKKRWVSLFDRIAEEFPGILRDVSEVTDEQKRGRQKRHHVLSYVRSHPEELRPIELGHRQPGLKASKQQA